MYHEESDHHSSTNFPVHILWMDVDFESFLAVSE
jgi:hypothetical protein